VPVATAAPCCFLLSAMSMLTCVLQPPHTTHQHSLSIARLLKHRSW
jgi:hypothetical protein